MRRWLPAVLFAAAIAWLWWTNVSLHGRLAKINDAIEAGELGTLSPRLQQRLEAQIAWLASHTEKLPKEIRVNAPVSLDRLDVVVTRASWSRWTKTDAGNAIYSPDLDAIFIDEALIYPQEVAVLGQDSNVAMMGAGGLDFATSYINFVLAHELGHRQDEAAKGGRAFFHYGTFEGQGDRKAEVAADQYAVTLLVKALSGANVPDFVREANALDAVGVGTDTTGTDLAAAEIMGAMTLMSKLLLFSVSPYSPFHEDVAHPTFLERAHCAMAASTALDIGEVLQSHAPVLVEEIRRTASLRAWVFQEVSFPGPIARVTVSDETVWLATRDLPTLPVTEASAAEQDNLRQHLHKTPLTVLKDLPFNFRRTAWPGERVLSAVDLDPLLTAGAPAFGLAPREASTRAVPITVFIEEAGQGYERYASEAWSLTFDGAPVVMVHDVLAAAVARLLGNDDVEVGRPTWTGAQWMLPVRFRLDGPEFGLAVLTIDSVVPDRTPVGSFQRTGDEQYALSPVSAVRPVLNGMADWPGEGLSAPSMASMMYHNSAWYVVSDSAFYWQWIRWRRGERHTVVSEQRFLHAYAGEAAEGAFRQDLDALAAEAVLFDEYALVWHELDSAYFVDLRDGTVTLLFHPATINLQVTPVGPGLALFWVQNARKGYVMDIGRQRASRVADVLPMECATADDES